MDSNLEINCEFGSNIDFLNTIVNLLPLCISDDVKHFIACQFALESAFGKSPLALCNHNFCGMKIANVRVTLANNVGLITETFASYSGITYCVHDYLMWLQDFRFRRSIELQDVDAFAKKLRFSNYCPDNDYISKIWKIYYQYYKPLNN